jgi:hypothetical protein
VRIAIAARVMNILSILNILRANFEWEGRESARPRTINIPIPRFQDLSLTGHLLSLSAFPSRRAFANTRVPSPEFRDRSLDSTLMLRANKIRGRSPTRQTHVTKLR